MRTMQIAPRLAQRGMAAPLRWRRITLFWRKRRALVPGSRYVAAAMPAAVATHGLERPVHRVLQLFDLRRRYLEYRAAQRTAASSGALLPPATVPIYRPPSIVVNAATGLPARLWRAVTAARLVERHAIASPRDHTTLMHRTPSLPAPAPARGQRPTAPVALRGRGASAWAAPRLDAAAALLHGRAQRAARPAAAAIPAVRPTASRLLLGRADLTPTVPQLPRMRARFALAARPARLRLAHHSAPLPARPGRRPAAGVAPLALAWARQQAAPAAAGGRVHVPAPAPDHAAAMARGDAVASDRAITIARETARQEVTTALHSPANLERLAVDVMVRIDKRLRVERERRGH